MSEQNETTTTVEVSAELDGAPAVFGAASELTLGVAGPRAESGVPQRSHV
jgi:hypothetical protein